MNNRNREHTVYFTMPDVRHYYVDLTASPFNDFICDFIGNISSCHIQNSQLLKGAFLPFHPFNVLAVLATVMKTKIYVSRKRGKRYFVIESDQDIEKYSRLLLVGGSDDSE